MYKCPKCLAEQNNVESRACFYCGADMSEAMKAAMNNSSTQMKNEDYIPEQNISLPDSDELGIETNADLLETKANQNQQNSLQNDKIQSKFTTSSAKGQNLSESEEVPADPKQIKKLSKSELKEIEKNLYKSDNFINTNEKSVLIEKINSLNTSNSTPEPFSNKPIEPHKKNCQNNTTHNEKTKLNPNLPTPKKAHKSQGLAYFYNNYIQIQGSQKLHKDDLLTLDNREYILKPKKLNNNVTLYSIGAALIFAIIILSSFLVGNSNFGQGQVIGVILDQDNIPFIEGATVVLSDLGEKFTSDSQGLFAFSNIPTGTHKIEYLVNNQIIGNDYITIAEDKSSYITLKPNIEKSVQVIEPLQKLALASGKKTPTIPQEKVKTVVSTPKKKTTSRKTPSKSTPKKNTPKKTSTGYGKLVLNANIDGAKIKIDGKTLGAGNLTYSKIKSGKHSYAISLDGYQTVKGSLTIKKGKTKKLSPILKALTQAKKEETFKDSDYFYSAENAFKQGDYETAISDYKKVIDEYPNSVKAYTGIASSYEKLKNWNLAYDNHILAAEIYRFKGKNNSAISSYNKAIKVNDKSTNAYIGRGNIYLSKKEYRAAYGDFDKVVKIDKRSFAGYYGLGKSSFKLLRYSKAIKYFKYARTLENSNPLVHQYLTLSYMYEHDRKNSKKSFDKFNEYASENEKNKFSQNSQYSAVTEYLDAK